MAQGGVIAFEWPDGCDGWDLPELKQFIAAHGLYSVSFDGCMVGVKDKHGNAGCVPDCLVTYAGPSARPKEGNA